jgi:hypothetical protein
MVEIFDQGLSNINMHGYAYSIDGREHSIWSTHTTYLDLARRLFTYTYEVTVVDDPKTRSGLCEYQLSGSSDYRAPDQLAGFTTDLHDPRRLHITEYKVSNKNLSKPEAKEQIRRLVREGKIPGEGWFATGALNAS